MMVMMTMSQTVHEITITKTSSIVKTNLSSSWSATSVTSPLDRQNLRQPIFVPSPGRTIQWDGLPPVCRHPVAIGIWPHVNADMRAYRCECTPSIAEYDNFPLEAAFQQLPSQCFALHNSSPF